MDQGLVIVMGKQKVPSKSFLIVASFHPEIKERHKMGLGGEPCVSLPGKQDGLHVPVREKINNRWCPKSGSEGWVKVSKDLHPKR